MIPLACSGDLSLVIGGVILGVGLCGWALYLRGYGR